MSDMQDETPKYPWFSEPIRGVIDGLVFRLYKKSLRTRTELLLVIDESTHFDSINTHRTVIRELARDLTDDMASSLGNSYQGNIYALHLWNRDGMGWQHIAVFLNFLCHAWTFEAYSDEQKRAQLVGESAYLKGDPSGRGYLAGLGGMLLLFIFNSLGRGIDDLDVWMQLAEDHLAEHQWPIGLTSEPFGAASIRDRVKYLREQMDGGQTIISEYDANFNQLDYAIYASHLRGTFEAANAVLKSRTHSDWQKKKAFVQHRLQALIEEWETSSEPRIVQMRELLKKSG